MQLKRDVRLTREIHDTATKLIQRQDECGPMIDSAINDEISESLRRIIARLSSARQAAAAGADCVPPIIEAEAIAERAEQALRGSSRS